MPQHEWGAVVPWQSPSTKADADLEMRWRPRGECRHDHTISPLFYVCSCCPLCHLFGSNCAVKSTPTVHAHATSMASCLATPRVLGLGFWVSWGLGFFTDFGRGLGFYGFTVLEF